MNELIRRFLEDLEIRNYSARTIADYRYHLQLWTRFLAQEGIQALSAVGESTLAGFQRWLYYQPTRRGGVRGILNQNAVLAALKSFFRFLRSEGCVVQDPAAGLDYARQPKSLPRNVLTEVEARRILDGVDTSTPLGIRDRAILEVLYATGIRKEELRNLTVGDVHLGEKLLRVIHGKGAKDRVVPLGRMATVALGRYLEEGRPRLLGSRHSDRLFLSYRGQPLDSHTLGTLVREHAQAAQVSKHVTPHVWRHTCATHLVQNHANLRHVQDLLGHGSLATTEKYLRLTITDLKEAHAKYHPREKDAARGGGAEMVKPHLDELGAGRE